MIRFTVRAALIAIFNLAIVAVAEQTGWAASTWNNPGTGDWHQASNWLGGVPTIESGVSVVNQGVAQISAPAEAGILQIGDPSNLPGPPSSATGRVVGTASLTTYSAIWVGHAFGGGVGTVMNGDGRLELNGADLTAERLGISVGMAGGTGTDTVFQGNGVLRVNDGSVAADSLNIGVVRNTGQSTGIARGEARMISGDITAIGPDPMESHVYIGYVDGYSFHAADAKGALELVNGNLRTVYLEVGRTASVNDVADQADGRLTVWNGNVSMQEMRLGEAIFAADSASGLFELFGGTLDGELFTIGPQGRMVLGIGGTEAGAGYSQALLTAGEFNGTLEAQFIDGFQPAPGAVFDLVMADSIVGNYQFQVTGLAMGHPPMKVEQTDTQIRLVFAPEPSSKLLLALAVSTAMAGRPTRKPGSARGLTC